MRTDYDYCEYCGRIIPAGELFCEFCRRNKEVVSHDPDVIYDPENDDIPHHELPEMDQRPVSLSRRGISKQKNNG